MSTESETAELQKEKALLINMLQSIEKEDGYLRKRLGILEEKLAIQELKMKIKARRAVVEQLKSKVGDLERRLEESRNKLEAPSPPNPEVAQKVEEPKGEESVKVMVS